MILFQCCCICFIMMYHIMFEICMQNYELLAKSMTSPSLETICVADLKLLIALSEDMPEWQFGCESELLHRFKDLKKLLRQSRNEGLGEKWLHAQGVLGL